MHARYERVETYLGQCNRPSRHLKSNLLHQHREYYARAHENNVTSFCNLQSSLPVVSPMDPTRNILPLNSSCAPITGV